MRGDVVDLQEVDASKISLVGGKGANLGELARLEGIRVPEGFCVATQAFEGVVAGAPRLGGLLEQLSLRTAEDDLRALAAEIRGVIEGLALPDDLREAVTEAVVRLGERNAYAVRSSATAEDLPTASFAGQHDTFLNVVGVEAILEHVSLCWASLFTDRAVTYRLRQGFDHRKVHMAVVIQKLVVAQAAGILFTADPVTSNRRVSSIEAVFGLGEALVSGHVNPDRYKVREGQVLEKSIATDRRVLTDAWIGRLERLGRHIEAHFGQPQDIEWCLAEEEFHIVQSRPVTTLFPVPDAGDRGRHVFVSVGHQQMMTDPMKPLGWSLFQLTAGRPMYEAGGRLFVDIAKELATPTTRDVMVNGWGRTDPLIGNALRTLLDRGELVDVSAADGPPAPNVWHQQPPVEDDPAIVTDLITRSEASIDELTRDLQTKSGVDVVDFIVADVERRRTSADPRSLAVIMAGMNAAFWITEHLSEWLGEKNAANILSQSVDNNVTSEMGLELLEVADVIRPHPEVIAYLRHARDEGFLEGLVGLEGGQAAHDALRGYLDNYGMRGAGEIDITRPRWSEQPTTLVPLLLSHIEHFEPGEGRRRFERGRQDAADLELALLDRLRRLPDGDQKADETKRMILRLRTFTGYREYPKYGIVRRYGLYKQALRKEAAQLVLAGVIQKDSDIDFLTLQELREVVRTHALDDRILSRRKAEHERNRTLTPPRVMTAEGEIVAAAYKRVDVPAGTLVGLAVSAGIVEGRARVVQDMAVADLEEGDILVTTFTDPSWTPLFLSLRGLVTEVGGLMTHGAVIAREYGLPAVVGVENATRLIADGQHIRVNGTDGYVELLDRSGQNPSA